MRLCLHILCLYLIKPCLAESCFPKATWPKLIGYGKADTEVQSIDRRASDGLLAMVVKSGEADLMGNAGTSTNTRAYLTYDPETEQHIWLKVFQGVYDGEERYFPNLVQFTPDGSKVLASQQIDDVRTMVYLNAETGELLGGTQRTASGSRIQSKDAIKMTNDGGTIVYIAIRPVLMTANIGGMKYDGTTIYNTGNSVWFTDNATGQIEDQKYSILISSDETTVFTFTTGKTHLNYTATDCRMDVFEISNLRSPIFSKGERDVQQRQCRFPTFHSQTEDLDGTKHLITLLTEYYGNDAGKAGFLQIYLKEDYTESVVKDQEKIFSGYDFLFTSAFFPSTELLYAMAVREGDGQSFLVQFSWSTGSVELWPMQGLSEDPNAGSYIGNPHLDSIIFEEIQFTSNNFPVRGYMVGGTKSIWTYNSCLASDFEMLGSYEQLFTSPAENARIGIYSRIELDSMSCNKKRVDNSISVASVPGQGRDDTGDVHEYKIYSEDMIPYAANIMDLSEASLNQVELGHWETELEPDFAKCASKSADPLLYNLNEPVFEVDDSLDYLIGSGIYDIAFTDWSVTEDTSCTIDFEYRIRESQNGVKTNELGLDILTQSNLQLQVETSDVDLSGQKYNVTVLATTLSFQCEQKNFIVTLESSCSQNKILLTGDYPLLQTTAKGPTVSALAPALIIDPYPEMDCGPYAFEIIWPSDQTQVQSILTLKESSGAIEVASLFESDEGIYDLEVKIFLSNFPEVYLVTPLQVQIGQCTQIVIEPPNEQIEDIYFVIGTGTIKVAVNQFIQTPECSPDLIYSLLDEFGSELDPAILVQILLEEANPYIIISTIDQTYLGQHKFYIEARSVTGVISVREYGFNIVLQGSNNPPTFAQSEILSSEEKNILERISITQKETITYQIPEPIDEDGDSVMMQVFLEETSAWLYYDQTLQTINKLDQSSVIPVGEYTLNIRLTDDNTFQSKESEWFIQIIVSETILGCQIQKLFFQEASLVSKYNIGSGRQTINLPDIIFEPDCGLSYPQLKIEAGQTDLNSILTLDSQKAVLNVFTNNLLLAGQTFVVSIRAEDASVDSEDLLISLSFETDQLPQFDMLNYQVEPLTCSKADKVWKMQLPTILYHEIQIVIIELLSKLDFFVYDAELKQIKVREEAFVGNEQPLYCSLMQNKTEIALEFNLMSNLLGQATQTLKIPIDILKVEEVIIDEQQLPIKSNFDPSTLWATLQELKKKIEKKQEFIELDIEQIKQMKDPEPDLESISQIGEVKLSFSEEMYLQEIFADFKFTSQVQQDQLNNDLRLRDLQSATDIVDLSSIIKVEIQKGYSQNSASTSLGFQITLTEYEETFIKLKISFDSPLNVSNGDKPDILNMSFVDPELFMSQITGKTLKTSIVSKSIPKQFPSVTELNIAVLASKSVQVAANTAFLGQFAVTICLAFSLKAMWNLMHAMQVMAYLKMLVNWPANADMMLESVYGAITLESIVPDYGSLIFGESESVELDEEESIVAQNLLDKNLPSDDVLHLGIFGIFLGGLIFSLLLYFLLKLLAMRFPYFLKLVHILNDKLFYNAWIRYFIESYLVTTHNCIFYLHIAGAIYTSVSEFVSISVRIFLITIFLIWPIFTSIFLYCKRGKLDEPEFKRKFISMYSGLRKKTKFSLTYNTVFSLRRLLLVLTFLALDGKGVWLIYAFNGLQSLYFWYMALVKPHEEAIHNRLEYFNELSIIQIQYMMLFFTSNGVVGPELQWVIGFVVTSIVGLIFFINMLALAYLTILRVKTFCKVRKLKRQVADISVARQKQKRLQVVNEANHEISLLNDAVPVGSIPRLQNEIVSGVTNELFHEDGTAEFSAKLLPKNLILIQEEDESKLYGNFQTQKIKLNEKLVQESSIIKSQNSYIPYIIEPEQEDPEDVQEKIQIKLRSLESQQDNENSQGLLTEESKESQKSSPSKLIMFQNDYFDKELTTNRDDLYKSCHVQAQSNEFQFQIPLQKQSKTKLLDKPNKAASLKNLIRDESPCNMPSIALKMMKNHPQKNRQKALTTIHSVQTLQMKNQMPQTTKGYSTLNPTFSRTQVATSPEKIVLSDTQCYSPANQAESVVNTLRQSRNRQLEQAGTFVISSRLSRNFTQVRQASNFVTSPKQTRNKTLRNKKGLSVSPNSLEIQQPVVFVKNSLSPQERKTQILLPSDKNH